MTKKELNRERAGLLRELKRLETSHERRRDIGDRLAEIGDARPGVGIQSDGIPDIIWLPVAPGGSIEIEKRTCVVEPFYIAKYPVTCAQFEAFIDAEDGIKNSQWWPLAPYQYYGCDVVAHRAETPNSPRDSVKWDQCIVFCKWLNTRLHGLELDYPGNKSEAPLIIGENAVIDLPTEWEWQWAAQAGVEQRQYPWGDWQDGYANTGEAGLGRIVPVGMYPQGAAACGALDMAGNLFEFCLPAYDGETDKVIRSGSFHCYKDCASTTFRSVTWMSYEKFYIGFRVVVRLLDEPEKQVSGRSEPGRASRKVDSKEKGYTELEQRRSELDGRVSSQSEAGRHARESSISERRDTETESWSVQSKPYHSALAVSDKSPIAAALLSFFLMGGAGQIYLGQKKKGMALIVVAFLLMPVAFHPIVGLVGMIDAYSIAEKMKQGILVEDWEFGCSGKAWLFALIVVSIMVSLCIFASWIKLNLAE